MSEHAERGLLLPEELLLLAVTPAGRIRRHNRLRYGIPGSILLELALRERVAVLSDGDLEVADASETGDELLDRALAQIDEQRAVGYWTRALAAPGKPWKDVVAQRLVERGLLAFVEGNGLGLFSRERYPLRDETAVATLTQSLQTALQTERPTSTHDTLLLSLTRACKLDGRLVAGHRRNAARERIERLTDAELLARHVSLAVKEVHAATAGVGYASWGAAGAYGGGCGDGGGGGGDGGGSCS